MFKKVSIKMLSGRLCRKEQKGRIKGVTLRVQKWVQSSSKGEHGYRGVGKKERVRPSYAGTESNAF
jgi:hypothetical protein